MKPTPEIVDQLRLLRKTRLNGYLVSKKHKIAQPKLPVVSTKLLAASIADNELEGYYSKDEVHDVISALAKAIPRIMLQGREIHINHLGKFKYKQLKGSIVTHANTGAIKTTAANFTPEFKFVDELRREISYKFKHALQLAGMLETDQYLLARLQTAVELSKVGLDGEFKEVDPVIVLQGEDTLTEISSYSRKARLSKMLSRLKVQRDKARENKTSDDSVVFDQQIEIVQAPVVD